MLTDWKEQNPANDCIHYVTTSYTPAHIFFFFFFALPCGYFPLTEECLKPPERQDTMMSFHTTGSSKEVTGSTSTLQVNLLNSLHSLFREINPEGSSLALISVLCSVKTMENHQWARSSVLDVQTWFTLPSSSSHWNSVHLGQNIMFSLFCSTCPVCYARWVCPLFLSEFQQCRPGGWGASPSGEGWVYPSVEVLRQVHQPSADPTDLPPRHLHR